MVFKLGIPSLTGSPPAWLPFPSSQHRFSPSSFIHLCALIHFRRTCPRCSFSLFIFITLVLAIHCHHTHSCQWRPSCRQSRTRHGVIHLFSSHMHSPMELFVQLAMESFTWGVPISRYPHHGVYSPQSHSPSSYSYSPMEYWPRQWSRSFTCSRHRIICLGCTHFIVIYLCTLHSPLFSNGFQRTFTGPSQFQRTQWTVSRTSNGIRWT